MTKRINKDGTLNYFEIIKDNITKVDFIFLNIFNIFTVICMTMFFFIEENYVVSQHIFRSSFILIISFVVHLIYIRTAFFLYKRDFYEKDLKKVKKRSKKSFRKLKENMNKLDNSIFMYKGE